MPFSRPPLSDITERIKADFEAEFALSSIPLRNSLFGILIHVYAGISHILHGFIVRIARYFFPLYLTGKYLDWFASLWSVIRKPATFASGTIGLTGNPGATVTENTVLQSPVTGVQYRTIQEVELIVGTTLIQIESDAEGQIGNLEADAVLEFVSPVAGVDSSAIVQSSGLTGGFDAESDPALLERTIERIQSPPHGGTDADYKIWAKEVPGITRAWVYPLHDGEGTVGVMAAVDDSPGGPAPDQNKLDELYAHLRTKAPITVSEIFTFGPSSVRAIDCEFALSPDTQQTRDAINTTLDAYFRTIEPAAIIHHASIEQAARTADGIEILDQIQPNFPVALNDKEIPATGTISYA